MFDLAERGGDDWRGPWLPGGEQGRDNPVVSLGVEVRQGQAVGGEAVGLRRSRARCPRVITLVLKSLAVPVRIWRSKMISMVSGRASGPPSPCSHRTVMRFWPRRRAFAAIASTASAVPPALLASCDVQPPDA